MPPMGVREAERMAIGLDINDYSDNTYYLITLSDGLIFIGALSLGAAGGWVEDVLTAFGPLGGVGGAVVLVRGVAVVVLGEG